MSDHYTIISLFCMFGNFYNYILGKNTEDIWKVLNAFFPSFPTPLPNDIYQSWDYGNSNLP